MSLPAQLEGVPVHLLVEALGIRSYGGATVLLDLLRAVERSRQFARVTVLGTPAARRSFSLPEMTGLSEEPHPLADRSMLLRALFYLLGFRRAARRLGADTVLSVSGMAWTPRIPTAVLIQHPMPFYPEAAATFSPLMRLRFWVMRTLMRVACRRARVIIVQSAEMRRAVGKAFGLAAGRFRVHTPCVTETGGQHLDSTVVDLMQQAPGDRRLLYVGSDAPNKNLGLLVEGIRLIRSELPGAILFATLPLGHSAGDAEGVVLLGVLDRGGLATAYGLATALCLASVGETVGLPLLEGMAVGLPVLAADRPYAHEMCRDAAGYFDPHRPADLAAEVRRLASDADLMAHRRRRGLEIMACRRGQRPYDGMIDLLADLASRPRVRDGDGQ